jgi:hypothetical protein
VRRRLLFAAILAMSPTLAVADESIAGQWQAKPGKGVIIVMDVLVDGHWASETVQNNMVVAQMAGTYEQSKTSPTTGKLVFTPITAKTTDAHGPVVVEEDQYTLSKNATILRLVSKGDVTDFHRQPLAK